MTATFASRDQAEAASQRLKSIGVAAEDIRIKDASELMPQDPSQAGSFLLSAKVASDKAVAAGEILRAQDFSAAPERPAQAVPSPESGLRRGRDLDGAVPPPASAPRQERRAPSAGTSDLDRRWLRNVVIYTAVAMALAFVGGVLIAFATGG